MRSENPRYLSQFMICESTSNRQFNSIKPELRIASLAPHVHVRRLSKIGLVKADSEATNSQDCRHAKKYTCVHLHASLA